MTIFLNVLGAQSKSDALRDVVARFRSGISSPGVISVDPSTFSDIPTSAFAYWTTNRLRSVFRSSAKFQAGRRHACKTNPAGDDTRYLRLWWEPSGLLSERVEWKPISKGGSFSPFYYDVHLVVAWNPKRQTYLGFLGTTHRPLERPASLDYFFRPGITWPSRTQKFAPRLMPAGSIFTGKGPAAFDVEDDPQHLLAMCAVMNSRPFAALVATRLNATDAQARSFEVGTIQLTPFPELDPQSLSLLSELALKQWRIRQRTDQAIETSHAFVLPAVLLRRVCPGYQADSAEELNRLQADIDQAAYRAYGVGPEDCAEGPMGAMLPEVSLTLPADEEEDGESALPLHSGGDESLISWSVGVAFGRFDWRIALGERAVPAEPEPLDPLPARSPGMLSEGVAPFRPSSAVMVDDAGHSHDLARAVEEVIATVGLPAPDNVRRWLQREFFSFHLQRYSKSRRKAPIYWPLGTASGSYTLWLYYPSLTNQTLYTAINDFLDGPSGKLKEVGGVVAKLRNKGSDRTRDEEGQFEALQAFELELLEMRDSLLRLAPAYRPSHDDGVQICAAPLWPLFRHKPWQKLLKDTWTKLEKGEYDWAHMAMNYWPDRVREKCKTDKSLAIAHGLESLYIEPEAAPKKTRGRKKGAEG